jgi:predicted RecB family nuclease
MTQIRLSKSKFVAGVQCLKRLYWQVYQPNLADPTDDSAVAILEQGHEVGRLACLGFPGGIRVTTERDGLNQAVRQTRELLANTEVPAIFEGAFEYGNVLVRVDILQRQPRKNWRLIEVKSTADVKDHHIYDVGIQHHVVRKAGVELSSVCLMHLNRDYVYQGGDLDQHRLFRVRNLNRQVAKIDKDVKSQIRRQVRTLEQAKPPQIKPGPHCNKPVICEFFSQCNPPLPDDHISYLPRIHPTKIEKLLDMGIHSIHDIPDEFPLSERARMACTSIQNRSPWYSSELAARLKEIRYPAFFMDFETVYPAIPRYPGMRPFDQLPFQWSVHTRRKPGAAVEHHEFLAEHEADPRNDFITSLCSVLGTTGTIVVYNQPFESQRLAEIAEWLPHRTRQIGAIRKRLWDLLPVVRTHVYHPAFRGSFSLKAVLPALVSELRYENMEVANGSDAGQAWESLVRGKLDLEARTRLKSALLAYCRQDTFGLVRLLEELQRFGSHR